MFAQISTLSLLLSLAASAQAQSDTASAQQLALVDAQYVNSGLNLDVPRGFGVNLTSKALLSVNYGGTAVSNGAAYTATQVSQRPTVQVIPSAQSASQFTTSSSFTLMLADASSLGDPDSEGNYRHYLANSVQPTSASSNQPLALSNGTVITYYAGPGPIAGTGPHRYAWLLFNQTSSFSAPSGLSSSGVSPSRWSVSQYVSQAGGLDLIAASFFTVENGSPTGSVASTAAVNTATLSVASSSSGSGSAATSAPAAGSTGSPSSGGAGNPASHVVVSLSSIAGFFGLAFLAL